MAFAPRRLASLAAAAALLSSGGCGDPTDREPLVVAGLTGARVGLTGTTWELCTDDPDANESERYREVHGEDGAVTVTISLHQGLGCAGEAPAGTAPVVFPGIARTHGDVEVGWDGAPPAGAAARVAATRVEIQSGSGFFPDVYLVDDTTTPRRLHTGSLAAPRDGDRFPTLLNEAGAVER